jgi:hypothetical protein
VLASEALRIADPLEKKSRRKCGLKAPSQQHNKKLGRVLLIGACRAHNFVFQGALRKKKKVT